ncbi:MAG TPA: hypothetical protein PLF88_11045 [Opitutaceae bacterium]|jgi:hypothetical protein|nr:hypothetical protein [Opitutaceae bacterium]HRJ48268.1 hypothetical protein [Opitutaceae bacterium]
MNDIDRQIQAALRGDDNGGAEPNIAEEVLGAFRGRHRVLSTFVFGFSFVLFIGAVWAGVKFYQSAPDLTLQLRWGGLTLLLTLMVSFIKVWFWLEMQSNRMLRELKRLELTVASKPAGKER